MDISIFQSGSKSITEAIISSLGSFLARFKEKDYGSFRLSHSDLDNATVEVSQHLSAYADDVDDLSENIKVDLSGGRRSDTNTITLGYDDDYSDVSSEVTLFMTFEQIEYLSEKLVKEIDKAKKIMDIQNS